NSSPGAAGTTASTRAPTRCCPSPRPAPTMARRTASAALGRALLVVGGALAARQALRAVTANVPDAALARTNFRGRTVSLAGGPALAAGASVAAAAGAGTPAGAAAALVAGLGAGAVGGYDDVVGQRPGQRAKGL